jgi:enoyl reductase-like protein
MQLMGGLHSLHFREFERLLLATFRIIRANANIFLNVLDIMLTAPLPAFA